MKKNILLSYIFLLTVFSCSRLDLAVNLANTYLTNKVDDFFNLTREQSNWLKEALTKDITTVKTIIFPQLASEMLRIADLLSYQKTFDSDAVLVSYGRLEGLYYDGVKLFASTAVALGDKLRADQIDYLKKTSDKKFSEMREDPEKKSYKKIKNHFDSWMGGMTSTQKKELKKFIEKYPPPIKETIYNRQSLVYAFMKVYPDKKARGAFVERLFTKYETMTDITHKKLIEEKNKRVAAYFANVLNQMSEDQKQTLIETLRERANQIFKISQR